VTLDEELTCCDRLMATLESEALNGKLKEEKVYKSGRTTTFELSEIKECSPKRKRNIFCPDNSQYIRLV
jgi:hypothetical protein